MVSRQSWGALGSPSCRANVFKLVFEECGEGGELQPQPIADSVFNVLHLVGGQFAKLFLKSDVRMRLNILDVKRARS